MSGSKGFGMWWCWWQFILWNVEVLRMVKCEIDVVSKQLRRPTPNLLASKVS